MDSVHEGKKSFQFNFCESCFEEKGKLKNHISAVHEGKKPLEFTICGASFTQNIHSKGHMELVHEENLLNASLVMLIKNKD